MFTKSQIEEWKKQLSNDRIIEVIDNVIDCLAPGEHKDEWQSLKRRFTVLNKKERQGTGDITEAMTILVRDIMSHLNDLPIDHLEKMSTYIAQVTQNIVNKIADFYNRWTHLKKVDAEANILPRNDTTIQEFAKLVKVDISMYGNTWDLSHQDMDLKSYNNSEYSDDDLPGIDFKQTNLSRASFMGATMLQARFEKSILHEAIFSNAKLIKANFTDAILKKASFIDAELGGAKFSGANMEGLEAPGAKMIEADLSGSILDRSNLTGASLNGATLYNVSLKEVILQGADFSRSESGKQTDLTLARMDNADLSGVIFEEAILKGASLSSAIIDEGTSFSSANLRDADLTDIYLKADGLEEKAKHIASILMSAITLVHCRGLSPEIKKIIEEQKPWLLTDTDTDFNNQ